MSKTDEKYRDESLAFHAANPEVYVLFCKFVDQLLARGFKRYSSRSIFHRIRWHTTVDTNDASGYKVNDHYSKTYGRLWEAEHPERAGFFIERESRD